MALTRGFQFAHMIGGGSTPMITVAEGASQTFHDGEILIASSGYAVVGAADPSAETIIGIATRHGKNDTAGVYDIEIIPALPGIIFEGQLQNAAGTATIAQATHMMAQFGVNVTSNVWWIDTDETTSKIVTIVGFKDAIGTLNGVVYFHFNPLGTVWGANIT